MSKIVHFEIPVENPEVSMEFYSKAFGWEFRHFGDENYWLVIAGPEGEPGINGGLMKKNPGQLPTIVVGIEDIDSAIRRIQDAGGKIVVEKFEIPNVGWVAYFTDPDGIVTGLHQSA